MKFPVSDSQDEHEESASAPMRRSVSDWWRFLKRRFFNSLIFSSPVFGVPADDRKMFRVRSPHHGDGKKLKNHSCLQLMFIQTPEHHYHTSHSYRTTKVFIGNSQISCVCVCCRSCRPWVSRITRVVSAVWCVRMVWMVSRSLWMWRITSTV